MIVFFECGDSVFCVLGEFFLEGECFSWVRSEWCGVDCLEGMFSFVAGYAYAVVEVKKCVLAR